MAAENGEKTGFGRLVGNLARTSMGILRNRGELLAVEWQEEKVRQVKLLLYAAVGVFLGFLGLTLLTAIVIFLFPHDVRVYVAGFFALLYLAGAAWAGYTVNSLLKRNPFGESLEQLKKDREWMESLE
jgi:uncharacterized membrane protein YqjE